MISLDEKFQQMLLQFSPDEWKELQKQCNEINCENIDSTNDISNYKYHYIEDIINKLDMETIDVSCQCLDFVINKVKENIRNIIILGLVQSGKTKEIIGIIHFCIVYLKIPIIIIIQNRISGYKQLEERIEFFSKKLKKFYINTRYVKTSLNEKNAKKIFNYDNPSPEVIICLSNCKQLNKLKNNIEIALLDNNKRVVPYVLIMDEYDDHIKSRQDITNKSELKKVEKSMKLIKDNSYINIGVTATLLACMLTDEKTNTNDIFQLKPQRNYVGYGSSRIQIVDINTMITRVNKTKRVLHLSQIKEILQEIDESIDSVKEYSITLINVSDDTAEHRKIHEEIQNEFCDWASILFNSNSSTSMNSSNIECFLPQPCHSVRKIQEGIFTNKLKIITITEHKIKIPIDNILDNDNQYFSRYSINFENYSVSEIITELLRYTNKVAIISGRMACRGISFVSTDYSKHITDMIYVPSGGSHLTRNVQDMRIYGNFEKDGIDIVLYTDHNDYISNVGNYISLQKKLLNGENVDDESIHLENINLRQNIMGYNFDPEDVPIKKIDRIGLIKGISFKHEDIWGISSYIKDYDICYEKIKMKYPEYEIIVYSKMFVLDLSNIEYNDIKNRFVVPTKNNGLSEQYKHLFENHFRNELQKFAQSFTSNEIDNYNFHRIWYILDNYRNSWPLHNPIKMKNQLINICSKVSLIDICYMGGENDTKISIILKNPEIDVEYLKECIGKKKIIMFYSKDSYHYTKCDKESYYVKDTKIY
jgi:hypothetical protein